MLIPLTRKTFETLIPVVATGAQYVYCWGKVPNLLLRLLISVAGGAIVLIISAVTGGGQGFQLLLLLVGLTSGLYWLWGPVLEASWRNIGYRKYPYSGFFRGRVLEVFISEDLIGNEETVNSRGDLVIVENRERRLNLEVGDESGFSTQLQVPLKRSHQAIAVGDPAEMLVLSNREDLERISKTTDIYIVNRNIWVSDYPYLQHEAFVEVSRQLRDRRRRGRSRPPVEPTASPGTLVRQSTGSRKNPRSEKPRSRKRSTLN